MDCADNDCIDDRKYDLIYLSLNDAVTAAVLYIKDRNFIHFNFLFNTEKGAKNAIKEIGEERLKKYLFEA